MQDQSQKWRDDNKSKEQPTVNEVVICAEDEIAKQGIHHLVICHVRSFHGEGFMVSVRSSYGGSMRNGDRIHLGKDEAAYAKAKTEGMALLEKQHAESEHSLALARKAGREARRGT